MLVPERADTPRIFAAGVVALRGTGRQTEALVVYRPDRKDWSLPKGKVDPGERLAATAVRETLEETGVRVRLGVPVGTQRYRVQDPKSKSPLMAKKTVHYWLGDVLDPAIAAGDVDVAPGWTPDAEVAEVRWVRLHRLPGLLTYPHDLDIVQWAAEAPRHTSPFMVLRHAQAEKRADYRARVGAEPSDGLRPLTEDGIAQAQALRSTLAAYGITNVAASSWVRCTDTVQPYAQDIGAEVQQLESITEEAFAMHPKRGVRDVVAQMLHRDATVVCIHRPTKKRLVRELGRVTQQPVDLALAPAEYLVFHRAVKLDASGNVRKVRVGDSTLMEYGLHHV